MRTFSKSNPPEGIVLDNLEQLHHALRLFASGSCDGVAEFGNQSSGEATTMLLMANVGTDPMVNFLQRLFQEIDAEFTKSHHFDRSFDYDGVGPFFKCIVEVYRLTEKPGRFRRRQTTGYVLSLTAAYFGKQFQERLSTALAATQ